MLFSIGERQEKNKDIVAEKVGECLADVKLQGKWSVDIMWDEESGSYYLIDMALAEESAYWNPERKGD